MSIPCEERILLVDSIIRSDIIFVVKDLAKMIQLINLWTYIIMNEFVILYYRPYALTSSSGHLFNSGKTVTKQSKRTGLYARRTGLANEKPPFDL